MRRSFALLTMVILLFSCKKEDSDFLWKKSFGQGHAYYLKPTPDSGFVSCGSVDNNPYLVKLSKYKKVLVEFQSEIEGLFSSAWSDTSCFIAGGSSDGKMLLSGIDNDGSMLWDTLISASFDIGLTNLSCCENGDLLAVGTPLPDSTGSDNTGILFVKFDTTGYIIEKKEVAEIGLISVNRITMDGSGNIFLPITRRKNTGKTQASTAKYTPDLNKLWETELFNNPDFGAESLDIITGSDDNLYISGNTELSVEDGVLNNSFLASLTSSGSVNWKKYIEKSNAGTALIFNENGLLMMLNRNCFVVSMANPEDGSEAGRLRMFDICDPYNTDAIGADFDLTYEGNLLIAGSLGGSYYLALKSLLQ